MPTSPTALSLQDLYLLLGIEAADDTPITASVLHQKEGQHIDILSMLAQNPHCVASIETSAGSVFKKPRVLLSAALLKTHVPTIKSVAFLSSLFALFDCYVWEEGKDLTKLTKITDFEHFFTLREQLHPASETEVRETVTRKGHNSSDYKVLDDFAFCTAMGKVKAEYEDKYSKDPGSFPDDPGILDTALLPYDDALWEHLAKEKRFTTFKVSYPIPVEIVSRIARFFPHITSVELSCINGWVQTITVPEYITDVRLSFPNGNPQQGLTFAPHNNIRSVEFMCMEFGGRRIDLQHLPSLTKLKAPLESDNLILSATQKLKNVSLVYRKEPSGIIGNLQSTLTSDLEKIHISSLPILHALFESNAGIFSRVTSLRIDLCDNGDLPLIDKLGEWFPKLKHFHIKNVDLHAARSVLALPLFPSLKTFSASHLTCNKLVCTQAPSLKTLQITHGNIRCLDISKNEKLQTLTLGKDASENILKINQVMWPNHVGSSKNADKKSLPISKDKSLETAQSPKNSWIFNIETGTYNITPETPSSVTVSSTDQTLSLCKFTDKTIDLATPLSAVILKDAAIDLAALKEHPVRAVQCFHNQNAYLSWLVGKTLPNIESCTLKIHSRINIPPLTLENPSLKYLWIDSEVSNRVLFRDLPKLETLEIKPLISLHSVNITLRGELLSNHQAVCPSLRSVVFIGDTITIMPDMMEYLARIASPHCTIQFACLKLVGLDRDRLPKNVEVIVSSPEAVQKKAPLPPQTPAVQNTVSARPSRPPAVPGLRQHPLTETLALNNNNHIPLPPLPSFANQQPERRVQEYEEITSAVAWSDFSNDAITPDTNIQAEATIQESGDYAFEVVGAETDKSHYRTRIIDAITLKTPEAKSGIGSLFASKDAYRNFTFETVPFQENDLIKEDVTFEHPLDFATHTYEKRSQARGSEHLRTVCMEGHFKPGWYPLVKNEATRSLYPIASDSGDSFNVFWHAKHRCHYFKLEKEQKLKLVFQYERPRGYDTLPSWQEVQIEKESLLPKNLHKEVDRYLKKSKPLAFIEQQSMPIHEKLEKLYQVIHAFESKDFEGAPKAKLSTLEGMFKGVEQHTGACRQRAELYMLLAQYLGCPVWMVRSPIHRFIEVPTQNGQVHRLDLGGTPTKVIPKESELFWKEKHTAIDPNAIIEAALQEDAYREAMQPLLGKRHIHKWDDFFTTLRTSHKKSQSTPLITLNADQSAHACNKSLLRYALISNQIQNPLTEHVFIQFPHELNNLLHPIVIDETTGLPVPNPPRPLDHLKLLVIDWTHFSDKERLIFQSLMDTPPTLAGTSIPYAVEVVGVMDKKAYAAKAFSTRIRPYTLDASLGKTAPLEKNDTATYDIPLHHSFLWRELLFGAIRLENGQYLYTHTTPFSEALTSGKTIRFVNPPKGELEWESFYARLCYERKYFVNGAYHEVEPGITFSETTAPLTQKPENVTVKDSGDLKETAIPIGPHNWFELFSRLVPDTTHGAKTAKGFLEEHTEFTLQGMIPAHFLSQLYAHVKEHHPGKNFTFTLCPGSSLENGPSRAFTSKDPALPITLSHDTDFTLTEWKKAWPASKAFPLVINVHPGMSIGDLCEKLRVTFDKDTHLPKIDYLEQGMLTELLHGRELILHGALNPTVYQALLPLLQPSPRIMARGTLHTVAQGALTLLMPADVKAMLHLPETLNPLGYSTSAYLSALPKEDHSYAETVFTFMEYAKRVAVGGIGRPAHISLSFARLKNMIKALKDPSSIVNKHNPTKAVFLYNFPHGSEDYCALNVLGKYFFTPNDPDDTPRITALRDLTKKGIDTALAQHPWKLLNCFRGQALLDILGAPLPKGLPVLPQEVLTRLKTRIDKTLHTEKDTQEIALSSYHKPKAVLEAAVQSGKTQLLFFVGEPGVGKTHLIRTFKDEWKKPLITHDGIASIRTCFEHAEKEKGITKLLLLDEADMQLPGVFDLFKALKRGDTEVYWDGALLPVPSNLIVCATGNGLSLPGRFEHTVFQDYGRTVIIKNPNDAFLSADIILPQLKRAGISNSYSPQLLAIFRHVQKTQPAFARSIRDLESLTSRFILLCQTTPHDKALRQAAEGEFLGSYMTNALKEDFLAFLHTLFPSLPLPTTPATIKILSVFEDTKIPSTRKHILDSFMQSLQMAQQPHSKGKRGVLIEGPPGSGKSTFAVAVMRRNGYLQLDAQTLAKWKSETLMQEGVSAHTVDPSLPANFSFTECFLHLNAGTKNLYDLLEKAAKLGMKVVLDEVNVDKNREKELNQYLCGYDLQGNSLPNTEFFLCATQNFAGAGTDVQSPALINRCTVLHMPELTTEERIAFAREKGLQHPECFVQAFDKTATLTEQNNDRMFYKIVKWFEKKTEFLIPEKRLKDVPLLPEIHKENSFLHRLFGKKESIDFRLENPSPTLLRNANIIAENVLDSAISTWKNAHSLQGHFSLSPENEAFTAYATKCVTSFYMEKYGLEDCPSMLIKQLGKMTAHCLFDNTVRKDHIIQPKSKDKIQSLTSSLIQAYGTSVETCIADHVRGHAGRS